MVLVFSTLSQDIPLTYSRINLGVSVLDCILFWLWGYSFVSIFAWILFLFELLRVAIAILLYLGVQERNLLKCKGFCIGEAILLCFAFLFLFFKFGSIALVIWTLIVICLRGYGIWIIGGFIRTVHSELGQNASFPWVYFPEPIQVQKTDVSPNFQIPSHI